jgi:16S rRNA (guanine527-N7)-methyltransferase
MNGSDSTPISLPEIAHALSPYSTGSLSEFQLISIARYVALLRKWNETIPLTSIEDEREMVARHFGESIFAASILSMGSGRLADVGSGAGFPGLPLKIALPELSVTLLEPNIKKCAFLREVQTALDMTDVETVRSRYEEFSAKPNSFDFICSRALGGYKRLLQWSKALLGDQGRVVLWLGMDDSTLISRTKGWVWELPVKIPESRRRVVLVGRPVF